MEEKELTPCGYKKKFMEVILENSIEKIDFKKACLEWCRCGYTDEDKANCVCTKDIKHIFIIYNTLNGKMLQPIGSSCINNIAEYNPAMNQSLKKEIKIMNDKKKLKKEHEKMIENFKQDIKVCVVCKKYSKNEFKDIHIKDIYFCMKCYQCKVVHNISRYVKKKINNEVKLLSVFIGIVPIKELCIKLEEAYVKQKHLQKTDIYGFYVMKFGKHKDKSFKLVVEKDKQYCFWLLGKKDFQENEYNQPFVQYCKYRL
jgi:hypothetical protein